jgi:nucleotide-binding universal stress UspA family protein
MTYRIVVGVDGSPHSEAALRWSLAEAQAEGGEVAAVFAWQVPFMSFPAPTTRTIWSRPPSSSLSTP